MVKVEKGVWGADKSIHSLPTVVRQKLKLLPRHLVNDFPPLVLVFSIQNVVLLVLGLFLLEVFKVKTGTKAKLVEADSADEIRRAFEGQGLVCFQKKSLADAELPLF